MDFPPPTYQSLALRSLVGGARAIAFCRSARKSAVQACSIIFTPVSVAPHYLALQSISHRRNRISKDRPQTGLSRRIIPPPEITGRNPQVLAPMQPTVAHSPTATPLSAPPVARVATPIRARNYRDLILSTAVSWSGSSGMAALALYVVAQISSISMEAFLSLNRSVPSWLST